MSPHWQSGGRGRRLSSRRKGNDTVVQTLSLDQDFSLLAPLTFRAGHLVMGVYSEHWRIFSDIPGFYPIVPFFLSCDNQCPSEGVVTPD